MGLLDNYTGIGMSPRPYEGHQIAMFELARFIDDMLDDDHYILTEWVLNRNDLNSPTPDVLVMQGDKGKGIPVMFIEIVRKADQQAVHQKILTVLPLYPSVKEAFLYNYETREWIRYDNTGIAASGYSYMLEENLNEAF